MKNLLIFTVTLLIPLCSCSQTENTDTDEPVIPPPSNNYVLQGSMQGSAELVEAGYTQIHQYMRKIGWDYSEHPNNIYGYGIPDYWEAYLKGRYRK